MSEILHDQVNQRVQELRWKLEGIFTRVRTNIKTLEGEMADGEVVGNSKLLLYLPELANILMEGATGLLEVALEAQSKDTVEIAAKLKSYARVY